MIGSSNQINRPVHAWRACLAVLGVLLGISMLWAAQPSLRAEESRPVQTTTVCEIQPAAPVLGTVFVCGGGILPQSVIQRFFETAGGTEARVVVVTTASSLAGTPELEEKYAHWHKYPHASIDFFHAATKSEANSAVYCEKFRSASAIWFTGGNQSLLADAYLETHAARMFHQVLQRGGVVGGTSAGAAIMSQEMIAGGREAPVMATGLGFLPGTIIDQHFTNRNRHDRLKQALQLRPGHVGIGIDESTAMIICGRSIEVMGDAGVTVCLAQSPQRTATAVRLSHGAKDDLVKLSRAAIDRTKSDFPASRRQIPEVKEGTLVIVGGGQTPREAVDKFLNAAGGKDSPIIVISNALGDELPEEQAVCGWLTAAGATNVRQLRARDKQELAHPDLLACLGKARGIWFTEGRQWRLVDAFLDTPIQAMFHGVLRRGGVIGGTSAGATIQGEYLVRGNPHENQDLMTEGYERGFGFLPGVAIDQLSTRHDRFDDMTELKRVHPKLIGIGIDESTALVVQGTTMEVVGRNQVAVFDRSPTAEGDVREYEVLKAGQKYDFKRQRLMVQAAVDVKQP